MNRAFIILTCITLVSPFFSFMESKEEDNGLSVEEFMAKVGKKEKPVLVYFYADWCQPCKELKPVLDQLEAEEKQNVDLLRLDSDANPKLSEHFEINSLPYFIIFKNGKNVWSHSGKLNKSDLISKISMYKAVASGR
jgi:thioredoxin 1